MQPLQETKVWVAANNPLSDFNVFQWDGEDWVPYGNPVKEQSLFVFTSEWLDEFISEALQYGYHTAKQEADGIPSVGYGKRFRKQYIKQLLP